MKIKIRIKQIKNEQRPDLPFSRSVKWKGGEAGSCEETIVDARNAIADTIRDHVPMYPVVEKVRP